MTIDPFKRKQYDANVGPIKKLSKNSIKKTLDQFNQPIKSFIII